MSQHTKINTKFVNPILYSCVSYMTKNVITRGKVEWVVDSVDAYKTYQSWLSLIWKLLEVVLAMMKMIDQDRTCCINIVTALDNQVIIPAAFLVKEQAWKQ